MVEKSHSPKLDADAAMSWKRLVLVLGAFVVAAGCADEKGAVETVTVTVEAGASDVSDTEDDEDPVVDETPSDGGFEFTELEFGDALNVESQDGSERSRVKVLSPRIAPCAYAGISCSKPQTGDRVISVDVIITNVGDTPAKWGADYFLIEFKDGTQLMTSDGNAFEYTTGAEMGYAVTVRPDSTYRSKLTFEAPNGAFSILVLTRPYDGEPFAAWS